MITNLRAQNFKSWKDTGDLRLAPLTGLFGTNSSGKSSILQVLLMMKQTVDNSDPKRVLKLGEDERGDDRSYVDLRSFTELIHGHDNHLPLQLSISWEPAAIVAQGKFGQIDQLALDTTIADDAKRLVVDEFGYSFGAHSFGMSRHPDGISYHLTNPRDALNSLGNYIVLPAPTRFYGFPPEIFDQYTDASFLSDFPRSFEKCLRTVRYLGPLRPEPQASYIWSGSLPTGVGRRGELAIQVMLAWQGRYRSTERSTQVANWLSKMKLIESFRIVPIAENRETYEVRVRQTPTSAEVLLTDVGFGVSQVLPVLVLCAYAEEGSTLLIEQPEMHLHPSAQSELADILIETAKGRRVQIIVESHSEHLLRRIQRRIGEGEVSSGDTSLYFCRIEQGKSKAEELHLTEDGFIKNWPKDFFGDEMGEVAALAEASIRRRRQAR
jgi:predicted ATPase